MHNHTILYNLIKLNSWNKIIIFYAFNLIQRFWNKLLLEKIIFRQSFWTYLRSD